MIRTVDELYYDENAGQISQYRVVVDGVEILSRKKRALVAKKTRGRHDDDTGADFYFRPDDWEEVR